MKSMIKTACLLATGVLFQASLVQASDSKSKELAILTTLLKDKAVVSKHIEKLDEMDFVIFNGQQWHRIKESHSKDVLVHWPDGRTTTGIDVHIEDMKAMFVWSPDLEITKHPVKFGAGSWTAVIGEMTGTFTLPMPIGEGKTIPPTGKSFKIAMTTIGNWENGVMTEEFLFWDNQEFMNQIGLGQ